MPNAKEKFKDACFLAHCSTVSRILTRVDPDSIGDPDQRMSDTAKEFDSNKRDAICAGASAAVINTCESATVAGTSIPVIGAGGSGLVFLAGILCSLANFTKNLDAITDENSCWQDRHRIKRAGFYPPVAGVDVGRQH
jgi:hypothetical protein